MEHIVRRGESMAVIASAHGVTVGALLRANPQVADPSLIFPGQTLTVPESRPGPDGGAVLFDHRYRVRSGDTMGRIARAFSVRLADLIAANPQIRNPDMLRVGEIVNVPQGDPTRNVQPVTSPPGGSAPLWYRVAKREMQDGIVEFPGEQTHNPRILEYHATVSSGLDQNEIPWCSSFVNWCMEQAGIRGTESARARSWERWGGKLDEPKLGAVVVLWRGVKSEGLGHVGFFVERSATEVSVLGGNQGDRVTIARYPKARLLSYRWPAA